MQKRNYIANGFSIHGNVYHLHYFIKLFFFCIATNILCYCSEDTLYVLYMYVYACMELETNLIEE